MKRIIQLAGIICIAGVILNGQTRIKDVAEIQSSPSIPVFGYSLVIGLDGSGDRTSNNSIMTVQSITNMLERFGITVDPTKLKLRNIAAVLVSAEIPPVVRKGTRIDVTVSSIGDARSLQGGVLVMTPLSDIEGNIYAIAHGPLSIGGYNIEVSGEERVAQNHALVGRIPNGAIIQIDRDNVVGDQPELDIVLKNPDYTSCSRIASRINAQYGDLIARSLDASTVRVTIPDTVLSLNRTVDFIATIEKLEVEVDQQARVVINERTGTVVVGNHVSIAPVAIAHGNLSIEISSTPLISQPGPFSQGQTAVVQDVNITAQPEQAKVSVMENAVTVSDVAQALNDMGVTPRDIIAIFQALKKAGALQAELIIM